jgi:transposase
MEAIMDVKPHHSVKELQKLYRTQKHARLARRIHGVYLACKGLTCPEIMEITGSGRRTIQQWVHQYNAGGIDALEDSPRPGQPTKLPRDKERGFCQRIEAGPTAKDGVSVFNGAVMARILKKEFGAQYSLWGTYHLLYRLGYSCLCPRPQHEKADPQLQEEFKKTSSKRWMRSKQSIPARK